MLEKPNASDLTTDGEVNLVKVIYNVLRDTANVILKSCQKRKIKRAAKILNANDVYDAYFVSILTKEQKMKFLSLLSGGITQ